MKTCTRFGIVSHSDCIQSGFMSRAPEINETTIKATTMAMAEFTQRGVAETNTKVGQRPSSAIISQVIKTGA